MNEPTPELIADTLHKYQYFEIPRIYIIEAMKEMFRHGVESTKTKSGNNMTEHALEKHDKILAKIIENAFKEGYVCGRKNYDPYDFYWDSSVAKQSAILLRSNDKLDKDK